MTRLSNSALMVRGAFRDALTGRQLRKRYGLVKGVASMTRFSISALLG